ncbi:hypothetical protein [Synechococcus phage S-N03]|uniref:Uncharacterized protein n=1 Tax=Synechococcus phage S-N03 TaxID=2718943 RepID=A0A6G8R5K2_9CAUD|nr:hypothetical protein PQC09_gp026 [Synechococcus phage S-N03]QIN96661.1 hypothetical protein [Synechococcus phage S-N03]
MWPSDIQAVCFVIGFAAVSFLMITKTIEETNNK